MPGSKRQRKTAKKAAPNRDEAAAGVRLQKRMAQLGIASRRESERLISAGRVSVNGQLVTELGTRVAPEDAIAVDGRIVEGPAGTIVIALHKPIGVICSARDPEGRTTVYDLLPGDMPHLAYVGRLDFNTSGLLLLTNDGELARTLCLPDSHVPRVYEAKVRGQLTKAAIRSIEGGIPLDGRPTRPVEVERIPSQSKHDWLRLTLFEGKNRQVRRILEAVGHPVTRLRRVAFGELGLEGLREGAWRELSGKEVASLRAFSS